MPTLIGVDEAGYGPNYGPLCVAATAWRYDPAGAARAAAPSCQPGGAAAAPPDLYKLLRKAVVRTPDQAGRKIAIADSKALYAAGHSLRQLERGVLAALAALQPGPAASPLPADPPRCIARVAELLAATTADAAGARHELPCHADDEQALPLESLAADICRLADLLRQACHARGVALQAVRARLVYPAQFNRLVDHFGSKGAALSHVTLELVRQLIDESIAGDPSAAAAGGGDPAAAAPILVCLDKHGGRNRYAALLQHHFPESWIEPLSENRNRSRYRWTHQDRPIEAIFRVGCEELLPTALASMTAKYHRELAMRAFNAYWTARVPELQPTAGYPNDSRRFQAAIAAKQNELGIENERLWRNR